jgi:hypothetical protein
MSLIVTVPQQGNWWQRLTGTSPQTVIRETSTTTITSSKGLDIGEALRNGGIGAAVGAALGGASLLTKIAIPIIGKVGSVAGLARAATLGGAIGVGATALPFVIDYAKDRPAAKATLIGAGVGAAAGFVLPLLPTTIGAAIGAGVGYAIHRARNSNDVLPHYPTYPGFVARPGWVPYGTAPGMIPPYGLTPVSPWMGGVPHIMGAGTSVSDIDDDTDLGDTPPPPPHDD